MPEFIATEKFLTRDALAPTGCEDVVVIHKEQEDNSTGELFVQKLPTEEIDADELGLSPQDQKYVVIKEKEEDKIPDQR